MSRAARWSRLLLGALLVLGLVFAPSFACQKPDSILLVEVASTLSIQPSQLMVVVSAGLDSESLSVPPQPVPGGMKLPTSFTVELDRSRTMPLQVSITALDASSSILACGTTVQEHFQVGGQTVITVFLVDCDGSGNQLDAGTGAPPPDDSGAALPADSGSPPPDDAGTPPDDAGTTPTDAGTSRFDGRRG
jgi:hypothetical protein